MDTILPVTRSLIEHKRRWDKLLKDYPEARKLWETSAIAGTNVKSVVDLSPSKV